MKRKPFTIGEHYAVGRELRRMARSLVCLSVALSRGYGKTKPIVQKARRVEKVVLALRSELDNIVCRENPDDNTVLRCYFDSQDTEDSPLRRLWTDRAI